jgi:hypothetical protein
MAAARRAPPPKPRSREVAHGQGPRPDPEQVLPIVDDGWQTVSRKKKRKKPLPSPVKRGGKVSANLVGLCFNCFAPDHIARCCHNPFRCLRCREQGHAA